MQTSPQQFISKGDMSRAQIVAIAVCVLLNMMDGYDILVMAFTAAPVAKEWGLSNSQLGVLLSSGLFGMAGGALFLSSLADKFGRQKVILVCAIVMALGMFLSGVTQNLEQLALLRFITGLGIGAMIASLNTIVAELSSDKHRALSVSILQTGNPIGGVLGGILAVYLISDFGWRSAFTTGGILTALLIPLIILALPESISYLSKSSSSKALDKVNTILKRFGHDGVFELSKPEHGAAKDQGIKALFSGDRAIATLYLCIAFFMVMFSFYFVMSWTPKLLVESGLSTSHGISGSIILNLGGIIGAPVLGYLSAKRGLQNLIAAYMLATAIAMAIFGNLTSNFVPALIVALFMGFFLFGSIIGLYALSPSVFKSANRATGTGVAIGVGRIGAVIAPLAAGMVLDTNLSVPTLYIIFCLPLLLSMIAQKRIKKIESLVD